MASDRRRGTRSLLRILIAEEDQDDRDLLEHLAANAGFSVMSVADGRAAWMQLRQGGFALAIVSLSLPILSGYELVARLKEVPDRPAVIALTGKTARVGPLDETIVIAVSQKPINAEMLHALLAHLAGHSVFHRPARGKRPAAATAKKSTPGDEDGDGEKTH